MVSLREEFLNGNGCPVIDMHCHLGPFSGIYLPECTLDAMVAGMAHCGLESITISPHSALSGDTREGNREMIEAVHRHPGRVFGYCTINPSFPQDMAAEMEAYLGDPGVVGIKIHPVMHGAPVDDARYTPVWERAQAEKRIVLSHTWGKTGGCGADDMRKIAERYPEVRLLLGHSCYGAWREAIALASEFPHVYLELTAAAHAFGIIEWMCREAGSHKVLFGTDYPWFDPLCYIGFVTYAHIDDDAMRNILYNNARRLLDEQSQR